MNITKHIASTLLLCSGMLATGLWVATPSPSAAQVGLPPRPTAVAATPEASPQPAPASQPSENVAHIQLLVANARAGVYTVVQWEGPVGAWHDVEGWQHELDANNSVTWSVYPRDYNTGPFRWAVFDQRGGALITASEAFHLPANTGGLLVLLATVK